MKTREFLSEVMKQAWQLTKTYGFAFSEALKKSWMILKLKNEMKKGIVKFFYEKLNGEVRSAWGTLKSELIPSTESSDRKKNDTVMVYFDQEKQSFRSFKKANLLRMA